MLPTLAFMKELKAKTVKESKVYYSFYLFITFLVLSQLAVGSTKTDSTYRVMFYNVENLFDTADDPQTIDEEFLPDQDRFWNGRKFNLKLNRIFQVIMAAGEGRLPVVIGLSEIENRNVLESLLYKTPLGKMAYSIVHKESPDKRGIDVAFLYRNDLFEPLSYKAIPVSNPNDEEFKTRDILYVKGIIASDTIHFFVNHWPSKYGGVVDTKPLRKLAAITLKSSIDSINKITESKIIVMGDFNDSPFDESITQHLNVNINFNSIVPNQLYNLSYPLANEGIGSNKYHGKWEMIDQIMVSSALLQNEGLTTTPNQFSVFNKDFLKEKDKSYLGYKPFRTYIGYKYNNGFSDHFPVLLDLNSN